MVPMVAVVAELDPQIAENPAQAAIVVPASLLGRMPDRIGGVVQPLGHLLAR